MSHLPPELIEAILEDVPESSLPACSLTAMAFVVASQRRLFRRMTLSDLPAYERVVRLLDASPHLAQYVRALSLVIGGIPKESTLMKSIILPLTKLERLSIYGGQKVPLPQNTWLIDVLQRTNIKHLALEDLLDVSSSLIAQAFSSCDGVLLSDIALSDNSLDAFPAHGLGAITQFDVLEDPSHDILTFVLDPKWVGSLRRLRRLSLTIRGLCKSFRVPAPKELLVACSLTLEHLTIRFSTPPGQLPMLPALRILEIRLHSSLIKNASVLLAISDSIRSSPHLEVLILSLEEHRRGLDPWPERGLLAWAALDSAFVNPDNTHLREIHFCLRWVEAKKFTEFVAFIQANFPRTFEAGMMKASHCAAHEDPMDRLRRYTMEGYYP
ncbi:hypothetical protein B0H16DRAFT_1598148 [Mycena metata]|uniref:F-box domain-containing protein n=1 Tax=Mycena metata TaxID=1033252 RepID=A0AAD7HN44_9AGAR|nr:hypothetical protein B0H16DRAFT_1598148 [Mycena metata]